MNQSNYFQTFKPFDFGAFAAQPKPSTTASSFFSGISSNPNPTGFLSLIAGQNTFQAAQAKERNKPNPMSAGQADATIRYKQLLGA